MRKNLKGIATGLFGIASALLLVLTMTACNKVTLAGESTPDGVYTVTAEKAKDDDAFMIGYEVAEDVTQLTVESNLEKGILHISLSDSSALNQILSDAEAEGDSAAETSGTISLEADSSAIIVNAEGNNVTTFEIEPGTYMLSVSGDSQSPATGTVTITPVK